MQALLAIALHPAFASVFLGRIVPTVQDVVMGIWKRELTDKQKVWLHVALCLVTAAIPVIASWIATGTMPTPVDMLAAAGVVFGRSQTYFDGYFKTKDQNPPVDA